jgi:hypothetical protein
MNKRDACTANVINVTIAFYITGVLLTIVFFDEEEQE